MSRQRDIVGAIVLGSDFKALGVVRSLGGRGIPCVVIDNCPRSAWFSRYVTKRFLWHSSMDSVDFLHFLLRIGKEQRLEQWALLPMQDEVVGLIAHNHQHLSGMYRLVTQGWDTLRWALDKRLTYSMAQEIGVSCPKTWYPTGTEELRFMPFTFPVIIKPAISIRLQHAMRLKALPARNHTELFAQYYRAMTSISADEIMVQEIIPGNGNTQYSVGSFCREGNIVLGMTVRRVRQYPIDYGLSSSFVEAIDVPALFEPAQKLIHYMRVSGMVEVEFKQDPRDMQYKLLDINVRPWAWHTLCSACGLDFPYIQYRDLLGHSPAAIVPRYGYRWVRLLTDVPSGLQEIRAGITTPSGYFHSLLGKTVFSVLDWRDPLPTFGDFLTNLSRFLFSRPL